MSGQLGIGARDSYILPVLLEVHAFKFGSGNWRSSVKYLTVGQIVASTCLIQPADGQMASADYSRPKAKTY